MSVSHDIDELFERFFGVQESNAVWEPPVDLFVTERKVYLMAEVPGVPASEIHVRVGTRAVHILGTKRAPEKVRRGVTFYESQIPYGAFEKRVSLPFAVNPDSVKVNVKDGVLSLELDRAGGSTVKVIKVE
ncbi:Hsp20/alpha crystallin family protein [candidate division WOR-3 bacterium]|nr:Hsp20/alpha crystallin family protein [candidate division WOR-3 bacterium]